MGNEVLVAVVTINKEAIGGDIPIFFATNPEDQARVANSLSRILKAMVHDVGDGVFILVRH
ncbi:MAG: hypothetical protein RO469_11700 [Thermincola sp.]|jgi:hypothetical protein|nr:hypothetical protein [Thermincola sp.]MDT3703760.1 hypothetical protein [Thermincola sp.]